MAATVRQTSPPPDRRLRRPALRLPAGSCDTHVHVFGPQNRFPLLPNRRLDVEDCTLDDLMIGARFAYPATPLIDLRLLGRLAESP